MSNTSNKNNLKKHIGSNLYNFLTRNFNDSFLQENLSQNFLLPDLRNIKTEDYNQLKIFLNTLEEDEKEEETTKEILRTPKEILDDLGYLLIDDIKIKKDYIKFAKYFASKEILCKFNKHDACKRYSKLFFIISKDIENIERSQNPSAKDLYSKSCMSVGVSQDKTSIVQITSRYNHTVGWGCDNMFNSNLENISIGLTKAFNSTYSLNLSLKGKLEFQNFYFMNNRYFFYDREINGIKYSKNAVNGIIYNSDYFIFENYILDIKNRKIKTGDDSVDSFCDRINELLNKKGKLKFIKESESTTCTDNDDIIFIV